MSDALISFMEKVDLQFEEIRNRLTRHWEKIEALEKSISGIGGIKTEISNLNDHWRTLFKATEDNAIAIKTQLDYWLKKNGEKTIKEYVREFDPSMFMKMKFKDNEKKIKELSQNIDGIRKHTTSLEQKSTSGYYKLALRIGKIEAVLKKWVIREGQESVMRDDIKFFGVLLDLLGSPVEKNEITPEQRTKLLKGILDPYDIERNKRLGKKLFDLSPLKKKEKDGEQCICEICAGDKLEDLNSIEDEDERYYKLQDFINKLLSKKEKETRQTSWSEEYTPEEMKKIIEEIETEKKDGEQKDDRDEYTQVEANELGHRIDWKEKEPPTITIEAHEVIKEGLRKELIEEIISKLEAKLEYLTVHVYEMKGHPDFESETELVFKELIKEYKGRLKDG